MHITLDKTEREFGGGESVMFNVPNKKEPPTTPLKVVKEEFEYKFP